MPIPRAIIDADTLYRRHPRNVLVWHALAGLFELHWSARIVAETRRNLVERNRAAFGEPQATAVDRTLRRVTDALRLGGAGSLVPDAEIAVRLPDMTNDAKDRHVLAAAHALRRHARFHGWSISELLALLANAEGGREPLMPRYVRRFEELAGTRRAATAP